MHDSFFSIKDFIKGLKNQYTEKFDTVHALNRWPETVGSVIASKSKAFTIKNRTLYIIVSDSMWLSELIMAKRQLIKKFNELNGKELITDLHIKFGNIQPSYSPPPLKPEIKYNLDALSDIKEDSITEEQLPDDALRKSLQRLNKTWKQSQQFKKEHPEVDTPVTDTTWRPKQRSMTAIYMYPDYGIYSDFLSLQDGMQEIV
jgi:hypothetical protein